MLLDLLQYFRVPLYLYCVPRCANSYSSSSSSIYYLLYCPRRLAYSWSRCLLTHNTLIMAMIAFAGSRSAASTMLLDTTGGVQSWHRLQQQHLERQRVTGGHFINIINKKINISSIKTIANNMSFPSVHRPYVRVVEGLSWTGMAYDMTLLLRASGMLVLLLTPNHHGHEFHLLAAWTTRPRTAHGPFQTFSRITFEIFKLSFNILPFLVVINNNYP